MPRTIIVSSRIDPIALAAIINYWKSEGFTPSSMSNALSILVKGAAASLPKEFFPDSLQEARKVLGRIGIPKVGGKELERLVKEEATKKGMTVASLSDRVKRAVEIFEGMDEEEFLDRIK